MRLSELINAMAIQAAAKGETDPAMARATDIAAKPFDASLDIAGLTADSRRVAPGFLFAALPGVRADGRAFIPEALGRGAVAVLVPDGTDPDPAWSASARVIPASRPRRAFARMAAAFAGRQPETVVAVTGTNGKTSTAVFTRQIWAALGHAAGSLGTLGAVAPGYERPGTLTTPDPVVLHTVLADMATAGCTHLALEASSHGLDQDRLDGVRVAAAAFTNLTHDHLDYHGTMDAYLAAKARLFGEVMAPGGVAVLNTDAPAFGRLAETCRARGHRVIGYGHADAADLRLGTVTPGPDGQDLTLSVFGAPARVRLPLAGDFQAMNALAALGLVLAGGTAADRAVAALATLSGVPGRMQRVGTRPDGAVAYVDYAHTPDALETVLRGLRPHAAGRLVCVFGCGGDRDTTKRPEMGEIAARLADVAIVTDDNPRTEDAAAIRAAILAACPGGMEIGDRAAAIRAGVAALGPGGVLLVAGKGHEQGQTVGDTVLPFDDAAHVRAAMTDHQEREASA